MNHVNSRGDRVSSYPLISVVVPVYNVEKYLDRCVESLQKQTYNNLEVVLVDDGSTDSSSDICDKLASEYENVVVYHKENEGLGYARNYGVMKSNGAWIVFVDSDDYVRENYISYMWNLSMDGTVDLVSCGIAIEDEDGTELAISSCKECFIRTPKEAFFDIYIRGIERFTAYSKLIRKEVAVNNPFPKGYFEDFATTYRYLGQTKQVSFGDGGENYRYIQRQGSILNRKLEKKHLHCFELCKEISEHIKKTYPEYSKYIVVLYETQLIQILNKQSMTEEEYKRIFLRYRPLFRKHIPSLCFDKKISKSQKIIGILLCTNPKVYRMSRNIKKLICKRDKK